MAQDQEHDAGESEGDGEQGRVSVHLGHMPSDSRTSDEPPASGDEEVEYVELVKVFNAPSLAEARLVKGMLEGAEVPCAIEDDASGALTDGLTGARLDGTDIFVPAPYVDKAKSALKSFGLIGGADPEVLNALMEQIDEAAAGDDEAQAALLAKLAEEPREIVAAAVRAMCCRADGAEAVFDLLGSALDDDNGEEFVATAARLAERGELGAGGAADLAQRLGLKVGQRSARARQRTALALGKLRSAKTAAVLVALLEDGDEAVRDEAIESLYMMAEGSDFGFEPNADVAARSKAVSQWRTWLVQNPDK